MDLIERQVAIDAFYKHPNIDWTTLDVLAKINALPSAQPTEASCWGCNCQKMERLKEQKTFSEMVHLHDAETHEERTETHARDCISRQAAIDALKEHRALFCDNTPDTFAKLPYGEKCRVDELDMAISTLINLPSAQPKERTETLACDCIN